MYEDDYSINGGSGNHFDQDTGRQPEGPPSKKGMGYGKKFLTVISLGLFFGVCGGLSFQAVTSTSEFLQERMSGDEDGPAMEKTDGQAVDALAEAQQEPDEAPQDIPDVRTAGQINAAPSYTAVVSDVTKVVESVMPAVVSVNNNYRETQSFYGREFESEGMASGSGIIVGQNDSELLIVTNEHVVYSNQMLEIQFVDGSKAEAQVKGSEPSMDLAVVAVNLEEIGADTMQAIAIATLGDSDALMVGEPAIAIGNALGYGQSVTTGVISAVNRESSYYTGESQVSSTFIQTDAAINPGNSGGALLNIKGEVIGINSNKAADTMIEGMGYAIPISAAKPIIDDLMQMETRARVEQQEQGYMGIRGITVEDAYSETYNLPKGAYITQVMEGTAAEAAGLVEGDIIIRFDGTEILSYEGLQERLSFYLAGEEVSVTYMHGDAMGGYQEMTVQLTLGSLDMVQQVPY